MDKHRTGPLHLSDSPLHKVRQIDVESSSDQTSLLSTDQSKCGCRNESYLDEFDFKEKVEVITMDSTTNIDVVAKIMSYMRVPCFAHCLNLASQKLYTEQDVPGWAAQIRTVVVWLKRTELAKPVLKEKQCLLSMYDASIIIFN